MKFTQSSVPGRAGGRLRRIAVLALLLAVPAAFAQTAPTLTETQAKASFVLNFARYVAWPDQVYAFAESPIVFCMIGEDSKGLTLEPLQGKRVQAHPVAVRAGVRPTDAGGCHLVFIADSEARRLVPALRALAGLPLLTISDIEGFIDVGGSIGLVRGEDRLQFDVNRDALQMAGLKASAHLLRLARNLPR